METCKLCNGSGLVAEGPWGSRPPRKKCRECGGDGKVAEGHYYTDETL